MRGKHIGAALAVAFLATCAPPPPPVPPPPPPPLPAALQPALIDDLRSRPWRHVTGPVTEAQNQADRDFCTRAAAYAPEDGRSPYVRYWTTYFDCLRGAGYEPILGDRPGPY